MKLYQVDAFTSEKFSGNPAGVCIVEEFPSHEEMQNIAMEMNLAETAFVKYIENDTYKILFFTPESEVAICWHATLSSAHILFSTWKVSVNTTILFEAKWGDLYINKWNSWYSMNFPLWPYTQRHDLKKIEEITTIKWIIEAYDTEEKWILAVTDISPESLKEISPDISSMKWTPYRAVIFTCKGDTKYDYYMRCFDAGCWVDEDPVTGSVECVLSQYWSEKLWKSEFTSFQCSQRGGEKRVRLLDERVEISWEAITVFEIEY